MEFFRKVKLTQWKSEKTAKKKKMMLYNRGHFFSSSGLLYLKGSTCGKFLAEIFISGVISNFVMMIMHVLRMRRSVNGMMIMRFIMVVMMMIVMMMAVMMTAVMVMAVMMMIVMMMAVTMTAVRVSDDDGCDDDGSDVDSCDDVWL